MSDKTEVPLQDVPVEEIEVGGDGQHVQFSASIKEVLSKAGSKVVEKVKETLVQREIDKRVDLLLRGLDKRDQLSSDLRKIKPDVVSVIDDGTKDGKKEEKFSPAKFKERSDLQEKLKKVCNAINSALKDDKPDYEPLKKCL